MEKNRNHSPKTINYRQELPLVILCGGKSSRMGEDKALLPFRNKTSLASYQLDRLNPFFKNIYLSSKVNKFDFTCDIIYDEGEVYSPLIALQTILKSIKNEKVVILSVDTPFVSIETINTLIKESDSYDICVAKSERLHSLCGVFSKSCLKQIELMLSDDMHKVGYLLKKVKTNIINFENDDEFLNLNMKEDYLKALNLSL